MRAVRRVYGKTSNKLPVVSHGPWSPEYTWTNTPDPLASGTDVQPVAAVSDRVSTPDRPDVHSLMPAFLFAGNGDTNEGLHRVYVFSDSDCVNAVYRGAVVGGPAYAPRTSGPLALPQSADDLEKARGTILKDGEEGGTFALDTAPVTTSETVADASGSTPSASAGDKPAAGCEAASAGAKVDLWDRDGKQGGRYYYAVVPVQVVSQDGKVVYRETELPQDACQGTLGAKRVLAFGKTSADAMPIAQAIGLSPAGRLLMGATSQHLVLRGSARDVGRRAGGCRLRRRMEPEAEPVARRRAHPDPRHLGAAAGHRRHVVVSRPRHQPVAAR